MSDSCARCTPTSPAVTASTNTTPAPSASSVRWRMPGPGDVLAPAAVVVGAERAPPEDVGVERAHQGAEPLVVFTGESRLAHALRRRLAGVVPKQALTVQRERQAD